MNLEVPICMGYFFLENSHKHPLEFVGMKDLSRFKLFQYCSNKKLRCRY